MGHLGQLALLVVVVMCSPTLAWPTVAGSCLSAKQGHRPPQEGFGGFSGTLGASKKSKDGSTNVALKLGGGKFKGFTMRASAGKFKGISRKRGTSAPRGEYEGCGFKKGTRWMTTDRIVTHANPSIKEKVSIALNMPAGESKITVDFMVLVDMTTWFQFSQTIDASGAKPAISAPLEVEGGMHAPDPWLTAQAKIEAEKWAAKKRKKSKARVGRDEVDPMKGMKEFAGKDEDITFEAPEEEDAEELEHRRSYGEPDSLAPGFEGGAGGTVNDVDENLAGMEEL
jgi:hypothetical protein